MLVLNVKKFSNQTSSTTYYLAMLRFSFLILICAACSSKPQINIAKANLSGFSYLALGDSYTIGESVAETDRWCVQLATLLSKEKIMTATPDIIAKTGWTTAELNDGIVAAKNGAQYDVVSLLIGVNNQYRGQSLERYRTEFKALLQTSIKFAKGRSDRVFVLSTPDWGVSPFANGRDTAKISREIDAFNAVAREESERAMVVFVDITPQSRLGRGDASMIAKDGLHFSGKMYQLWAGAALPMVIKLLEK